MIKIIMCVHMCVRVCKLCECVLMYLFPLVYILFYIKEAEHHVSMWLRMTNLLSLSTAMQLSIAWPGPCFPAFLTQATVLPAKLPTLPKWSSHFQGERLHGITHFVLGITFSLLVWLLGWTWLAGSRGDRWRPLDSLTHVERL